MKKNSITRKAFAKINLFFEALYKRDDGFHEVRTVMHTISLYDDVKVSISDVDSFFVDSDNPDIPTDDKNIVIKALKEYRLATKSETKFKIELKKRIPSKAGLSGGSADAAQALLAFNYLDGGKMDILDIKKIGSKLGSDVNFHFYGGMCACFGKGDKINVLPSLRYDGFMYIVMPDDNVSTVEAYKKIKKILTLPKKNSNFKYLFKLRYLLDGGCSLTENIYNQFEEVVYEFSPLIKNIKGKIESIGVDKVWMTGSGSALVVLSKCDVVDKIKKIENIKSIFNVNLVK